MMLGVSASIIFCVSMGLAWHVVAFMRLMFSNRNRGHRWGPETHRVSGLKRPR